MSRPLRRHAVVIGASVAGLATARVLSDHFDSVTVVDRDQLPDQAQARRGVPQGRHAHALLGSGAAALAQMFPGVMEELVSEGAALVNFNEGRWHQAGGYRARSLVERRVIAASRPFIEAGIRRRVAALPNVQIASGTAVEHLLHDGGRVIGVQVFDGLVSRPLRAELVVDCTGRSSRGALWMEEMGYAAPDTIEVRCDMRYGTAIIPRDADDLDATFAIIIETPPHGRRAGFLMPIEGDRWIVMIAGGYGAEAPVDEASFRALAASLPSPEISDVLDKKATLGPVATHRLLSSKRRRYERLKQVPAGFLALGDSICSFNPVYGQGMSSAVLQAVELGRCLEDHENDESLVTGFYKQAAKVIANPWQIAVGADFAYPECTGPKPAGTDLMNRYMGRVLTAALVSPEVNTAMLMVQNLMAPPSSLLRPAMLRKVRRAAREADRRRAAGALPTADRMPVGA